MPKVDPDSFREDQKIRRKGNFDDQPQQAGRSRKNSGRRHAEPRDVRTEEDKVSNINKRTAIVPAATRPPSKVTIHASFAAAAGAMREVTPFGVALNAARQITEERPYLEQPNELAALKDAMAKLDDQGRVSLFWLLVRGVVIDSQPVQPMFAVARQTGLVGAAYNAAAIARATREGGLTVTDLKEVGLVEVKFREVNGREIPHLQPMVGHERVGAAVKHLRQAGKTAAADVLDRHIRNSEKSRLLGEATKARNALRASSSTATPPADPETKPES